MATRDSDLTNRRRCTAQAALAVAALGGKFYDALGVDYGTEAASFFDHTRDWSGVRGAVVATREEAISSGAYFIERPLLGGPRNRYGWRLCSFAPGTNGAHSYSGEAFADADSFWAALRTTQDLAERIKRPEPRTIEVHGRRWFEKTNGNTYHSVEIVDGDTTHVCPYSYGYGDGYEQTAIEWLISTKRLPVDATYPLSRYCRENGIKLTISVVDVPRKRDLHNGGKVTK